MELRKRLRKLIAFILLEGSKRGKFVEKIEWEVDF